MKEAEIHQQQDEIKSWKEQLHDTVEVGTLLRHLDRCDRLIQNESSDPHGGNMCSFSGATCMSRVRHNAN